ncbi:PIN domain-containing protein [Iamia sp.]|uniref:PIN domain-containing protein n=1 Tax=Iamia sp. TaxID=2722710 RepID=UPI002BFC3B12|nr:PIN domain-containing protein [Iamia sp.]HXH56242.1 PIN domain-containing protein [Iamia sp.]
MAGDVVVLDANVLYGIEVTDLVATMATRRLFRPHWSPQILGETRRNLTTRPDLDPAAIDRRLDHLNRALPDALREIPPSLIEAMPVNEQDRHVLALAVAVRAPTIVTENQPTSAAPSAWKRSALMRSSSPRSTSTAIR